MFVPALQKSWKEMMRVEDQETPRSTPIKDFYRGKSIFVTGGTGGIGQLLVQKLLRINVKRIYVLTRAKRSKTPLERITELYTEPVFERARHHNPNYMDNIKVVNGDLSEINLGISDENLKEIIKTVEIVFHVAADVTFDKQLTDAIKNNLIGTREMLKIAEQLENFQSFVYMSTAYSNSVYPDTKEKFYTVPIIPEKLIKLVEQSDENMLDVINIMSLKMIRPWPNTYSFTKCLCEDLIRNFGEKHNAAIIRPSIVTGTANDPLMGWADNLYGIQGMIVGITLGLMKVLKYEASNIGDLIPADFVVNETLAIAWNTVEDSKNTETKIYNCTSSYCNPLTWGFLNMDVKKKYCHFMHDKAMWTSNVTCVTSEFLFKILTLLFHVLPAILYHLYTKLRGKKSKVLKMVRRLHKLQSVLDYYIMNQWVFDNSNTRNLIKKMSLEDQIEFDFNVQKLDWDIFFKNFAWGVRIFVCKFPHKINPDGLRRFRWIKVASYMVQGIFYYILICLSMALFNLLSFTVPEIVE